MKKILIPAFTIVAIVTSLSAQTSLSFNDLNSDVTTANTLSLGGLMAGLTVTGAPSGDNYLYSVTYTGADYDGDTLNDTLTFGVLVERWTDSTQTFGSTTPSNSDSSVTIGTTSGQVQIDTAEHTWHSSDIPVSSITRFEANQSLQFSIVSLDVDFADAEGTAVFATGFTQVRMEENAGSGHRTIFGAGSGLDGHAYNADLDKTLSASYGTGDLFVTGAAGTGSNNRRYGVTNVDFDIVITVIPEPGTYALFVGLTGVAFVMLRRRRG
ncbi:PEP-CTERM sorting domain-containing protein [Coraliomargarita algicola]|uniref:PEP-CTERM sorting domain-containing protein n=1 Tax=Coraliomargarita algicola TaxID=3092156 RepID=A0ABZ0RSK4_9BACT|nr:PEP-CTERM sorting domain-containing protein [Coraliomargarita sp. J2-16]WPJ95944.1 PEP-CTERM sorting domain-containing protein [Coraliomargarita sp. J2-16]